MTGNENLDGRGRKYPRSRLGYGFGSAPLPEPRRVLPRLAVFVAVCDGVGEGRHLPSVQDQLRACRERLEELGGSFDPASDVFVAWCGRGAPAGPAAVLESAVREGLFDGVVIAGLGVLPAGRYQVFAFRLALVDGACELYVVDRPEVSLWGDGSSAFDAAASTIEAIVHDDRHTGSDASSVPDGVAELSSDWLRAPEILLRRPQWPSPSRLDQADGLGPALATATFLQDTAEADLAAVEDAVLAEGGVREAPSFALIEAASQRFRLARMRVLILRELVGRGGSGD